MNSWKRWLGTLLLVLAPLWWLSGCSGKTDKPVENKKDKDHKDHKEVKGGKEDKDHKDKDHKDKDHDKALTEKDVKMPDSFKAGTVRLEELHEHIHHQISDGKLKDVHRTAEEMMLVAKKMKELAAKDVPENKQTDAGRLCNDIATQYKAIDAAADNEKKAETEAVHKQMAETIAKLKALAK